MFKKLFTPRTPKQATPEAGSTFRVVFPTDYTKPRPAPVVPLVEQIRSEVKSLTEQISAIPENHPLDVVNIEHQRDMVQAAQRRVETAQAQCRAGLVEIGTIPPLQDDKEGLYKTLRAALDRKQQRDTRVMLVARLRDLQEAAL